MASSSSQGNRPASAASFVAPKHIAGIDLAYKDLTRETLAKLTGAGKLVGVYHSRDEAKVKIEETKQMWDRVFSLEDGAVSFFYSDKPVDAIRARNSLQK